MDTRGFEPRPREGGDIDAFRDDLVIEVSIHAPAKGATTPPRYWRRWGMVSIHAPAKGATFRENLLEERRALMQDWADFLTGGMMPVRLRERL
ncbi:hypothetical protein [Paracoccus amoyensis]|uniref:hypothetical protein n=1 Tax=Paracoccus amoyensis TaxID=2760093 RepID=UPI003CCD6034